MLFDMIVLVYLKFALAYETAIALGALVFEIFRVVEDPVSNHGAIARKGISAEIANVICILLVNALHVAV